MDVGALTPPSVGLRGAREADVFYERASGSRHARQLFRPGGVHQDLPQKLIDDIEAWCDPFPAGLQRPRRTRHRQPHFQAAQRRYRGGDPRGRLEVGLLGRHGAGLGAAWDLRKAQPYECYEELEFDIPVGRNGDNYDRQIIRMEEMRQSVGIMKQCLERLRLPAGQGPIAARDGKVVPPSRKDMKRSMEALIQHFKLYTEGFHVPAGEVYAAVEAPKGEFGVYLVADGTNKAYRCKIRAPSFVHLQAMDSMCRGHMLADVSACSEASTSSLARLIADGQSQARTGRSSAQNLRFHGGE
jgi:NADH-quinone oxidoreductase subunit D